MAKSFVLCFCTLIFAAPGPLFAADSLPQLAAGPDRLITAARDGHLEEVRRLISEGVDVNARLRGSGTTALMDAANQGYVEIVELLLAAGADPGAELPGGWTALDLAVGNGRLAVVERLLQAPPNPAPERLQRALLTAARNGRPETAATLIAAGADVRAADEAGRTPLALAAKAGHPQTARRLLELGADVTAGDREGRTPLMWAAWQGHRPVVELLLAAGADPTRRDRFGDSAFAGATAPEAIAALLDGHAAAIEPTPEACPFLIGYGLIYRPETGPRVSAYGLTRRPEAGSSAWLVPHAGAAPLSLLVGEARQSDYPEDSWDADFEAPPAGAVAGDGPVQENATLLWAPPERTPARVTPRRPELPWGVFPETVRAAIDLDGDGRPDALDTQYCCGDTTTGEACEYLCGDYWLKEQGTWLKCDAWNPA